MDGKRIKYIDLFRAFGIILMIMGHINFGVFFDKWIHAFHMPMYFIISGYFFQENFNLISIICSKVKSLLIPYFIFGIFHCMIFVCMNGLDFDILGRLFALWGGVPIAGALWFLVSMFFCNLVYYSLCNIFKNNTAVSVLAVIISVLGMCLATFLPFPMPLKLDSAFVGVGLFHCGRIMREKNILNRKLNLNISVLMFLCFSFLVFCNGYINLRTGEYSNWILFWINALGLTISGLSIFKLMDEKIRLQKIKDVLVTIGRDSICFLCLNQFYILCLTWICLKIHISVDFILVKIVLLFLVLLGLYITDAVIQSTFLRFIFGKNKPSVKVQNMQEIF